MDEAAEAVEDRWLEGREGGWEEVGLARGGGGGDEQTWVPSSIIRTGLWQVEH